MSLHLLLFQTCWMRTSCWRTGLKERVFQARVSWPEPNGSEPLYMAAGPRTGASGVPDFQIDRMSYLIICCLEFEILYDYLLAWIWNFEFGIWNWPTTIMESLLLPSVLEASQVYCPDHVIMLSVMMLMMMTVSWCRGRFCWWWSWRWRCHDCSVVNPTKISLLHVSHMQTASTPFCNNFHSSRPATCPIDIESMSKLEIYSTSSRSTSPSPPPSLSVDVQLLKGTFQWCDHRAAKTLWHEAWLEPFKGFLKIDWSLCKIRIRLCIEWGSVPMYKMGIRSNL